MKNYYENEQSLADELGVENGSEEFREELMELYNVELEDIEGAAFQIIDNEIHIIE